MNAAQFDESAWVLPHSRRGGWRGTLRLTLAVAALTLAAAGCSGEEAGGAKPAASDTAAAADSSGGTDAATVEEIAAPDTGGGTTDEDAGEEDAAPAALLLESIEPASGKASGNQPAILYGKGFQNGCQVLFDGTPVDTEQVFFVDDTELQVQTPPHAPGLASVTVINPPPAPGEDAPTSALPDAYLFYNDVVITKIDPVAGPAFGGTPITITGTGFAGQTKVLIGGKPALGVTVVGDDEILAVTPPGVFGATPVHVVNERGTALLKDGFFYTAAPTLERAAPAAGPTAGGNEVEIEGTGLMATGEIRFGTSVAAIVWVAKDHRRARVMAPTGKQGPVDLYVTTKFGKATLTGGYAYTDDQGQGATALLSIAPAAGPLAGGQSLSIAATGLLTKEDTTVLIGGQLATITAFDAIHHTVVIKTPKGIKAGKVDVVLLTSKGTDTKVAGYEYLDLLSISSVTPAFGPPTGNTKITIKGSGFTKPGQPVVRIGALPATTAVVVDDATLQAVTPPGAAGYVDVSVELGGDVAVAHKAYSYTGDGMSLYVVFPDYGAQAGGTQVHVYGNGFGPKTAIWFDNKPATHMTFVDPTHIICKTPPGKVGTVAVKAATGNLASELKQGFTYFNPMSKYGGTWGATIDGAVNVTVLDGGNGEPIPDAFTMLWTDPTTPHQGFTDAAGQITFSGDDVLGVQMISASKAGYESASVIKFDATNVTIYLEPIPPPSPGSPPPGQPPPKVSGKVINLDKYVQVPTGNCNEFLNNPNVPKPTCSPCGVDSQCASGGPDFACIDIGASNGKRCVQDCTQGVNCATGFSCVPQAGGPARCLPKAGDLAAVCYHSKPNFLSRENWPPVGAGFEATPQNSFSYNINTAFGEMAIVCFGGYKATGAVLDADDAQSMMAFTATVMGVKRHLFVGPGENPKDVNIVLNMPLSRKASLRLDRPPTWTIPNGAYIVDAAISYLTLGSDGVVKMPTQDQKFLAPFQSSQPDKLEIDKLPAAFANELFDASLTFLAFVVQIAGDEQMPVSVSVLKDVKKLNNDDMVRRLDGGDLELVETGVAKTVRGMWGSELTNTYAVGDGGALYLFGGNGWTQQAAFTELNLLDIYGTGPDAIWVVGEQGTAAHFNGQSWSPVPMWPPTTKPNLNAVFAATNSTTSKAEVWAAGQSGTWRLESVNGVESWKQYPQAPYFNVLAMHGTGVDDIWTVGMQGKINQWDGKVWKAHTSGTAIALNSVWAVQKNDAWAVGEAGQILRWNGVKWTSFKSPVKTTLHTLWGVGKDEIWAAGARGVVLRFDGKVWKKHDLGDVTKALYAVWADSKGNLLSMGEQELLIGPLLDPPHAVMPKKNGVLTGTTLEWEVRPDTPEPHFNYVTVGIPGMGGDTPVWNIMSAGDLTAAKLPDFPNIQGTPGIPKGTALRLTMIRGFKEGFDIDAYDLTDLNQLTWRSWSFNTFLFTRQ